LSRLKQRLLAVKKVEEGRFVLARTKTSCCEGGRREKGEGREYGFVSARTKTSRRKEGRRKLRRSKKVKKIEEGSEGRRRFRRSKKVQKVEEGSEGRRRFGRSKKVQKVEDGSEGRRRSRSRPNKVRLLPANARQALLQRVYLGINLWCGVRDWPQTLAIRFS
jgi:hypothetical protein